MAKEPEEKAEREDKAEAAEAEAKAAAPKTGMLVVVVIGFLVMILTPLITFFVVKATVPKTDKPEKAHHEGGQKGEHGEEGPAEHIFVMEPIVVNIKGTVGTRYLKIEPHLLVSDEPTQKALEARKAMLYDQVSAIAADKTLMDLEGESAREALKKEIKQKLNAIIRGKELSGTILDIYFKVFMIQ